MPSGFEAGLSRAAGRIVGQILSRVRNDARARALRDSTRPLMAPATADGLLDELSPAEAAALSDYLESPDFEQVALQAFLFRAWASTRTRTEHVSAVREQIRHGLRLAVGLPGERLLGLTDVVLDAVLAASRSDDRQYLGIPEAAAIQGHVTAAGARNGALLSRLSDLRVVHDDVRRLRSQIAQLHADLRMPHTGKIRSVAWNRLYVEPELHQEARADDRVHPGVLVEPGGRHVILGDPGAGKSTLAQKLAHDLAANLDEMTVPLLVVLRHFSAALQAGERTLAEHLVSVGKEPYNVELSPETVDYLLLNGRAVVILDGLDELIDVALRGRVADLVKGFTLLYPLVPVIATSRRVGYADACLDQSLFQTIVLASFDRDRVEAYVRHWFALDEGSTPTEREGLADAFLRETESIQDLRNSPLLLSVLCTMYASDHYIPGNRGEIYERCALMIFDQWDRVRGISRTLGFEGRVRGAVQHLAWQLFTESDVPERSRRQILRTLGDYLAGKGFDQDQATQTAAEFLDYCSGRAWILAEVGSTATEPIFGFAHRTFLEYFSAEHLVRSAQTPERVWATLAPRVRSNGWEVVAQLAVQLIDRNVDDGGDAVLRLALADIPGASADERTALVAYCARSVGDVCVSPATVERIVTIAVNLALAFGTADRLLVAPVDEDFDAQRSADGPLYDLMYRALPGNLPFVRRNLADSLAGPIEAGDNIALLVACNLGRAMMTDNKARQAFWSDVTADLRERHAAAWERWRSSWPLGQLRRNTAATEVMRNHGVQPFYLSDLVLSGAGYPWALELLIEDLRVVPDEPTPLPALAHEIREILLRQPTPWLPPMQPEEVDRSSSFVVRRLHEEPMPTAGDDLATRLILTLPYLEYGFWGPEEALLATHLREARHRRGGTPDLTTSCETHQIPAHVSEFLVRWAKGEVNTVGDVSNVAHQAQ